MITQTMFAIPVGITEVSQSTCDKLKPLRGHQQEYIPPDMEEPWNALRNHPEIKQELTNEFTTWVNGLLNINVDWAMTTSWITENPTGAMMNRHFHTNCLFSSVLYFDKVEANHPPLHFENPLHIFSNFMFEGSNDNEYHSDDYFVELAEGRMIFFPSYLKHYHPSFEPTSTPRRSLACNFFPTGSYGLRDSYINTKWLTNG